uniref:t-SNARE coiled-coil homology domain-containing protein n=1 Tax=Paramoeba aestuarina TaxID=180227 RepID=A0A7S4JIS2_9EUKA|mmetsp:Transcript_10819/g.16307  ORF Transcript_10819/g.16307 Transcript_10819/m.16307 type:complete len:220 (+) Transcript_10819:271-930(+)
MTHLFASYERDFADLSSDIKEKIRNIRSDSAGRSREVAECEGLINDAIEVLETMELGVNSVSDPNEKKQMEGRIYNYREQLDKMKEDMRMAEMELSDKDKLFSGASSDLMITSKDQREQMLKTTQGARNDTAELERTARLAEETLSVAVDTAAELERQGSVLENMMERFAGINDTITSVRRNLGEMFRRNMTNKIIIAGIILILICTVFALIYIMATAD